MGVTQAGGLVAGLGRGQRRHRRGAGEGGGGEMLHPRH